MLWPFRYKPLVFYSLDLGGKTTNRIDFPAFCVCLLSCPHLTNKLFLFTINCSHLSFVRKIWKITFSFNYHPRMNYRIRLPEHTIHFYNNRHVCKFNFICISIIRAKYGSAVSKNTKRFQTTRRDEDLNGIVELCVQLCT